MFCSGVPFTSFFHFTSFAKQSEPRRDSQTSPYSLLPLSSLHFCLRINPRLLAGGGLAVCSRLFFPPMRDVVRQSHAFVLCNPEAICSVAASPVKGASSLPKRSSPALVEPPQPSAPDARLLCRRTTSPASYKITNTLLL
jgi:hypothetical protein